MRFRTVAVPLLALGLLAVPAEAAPKASSCVLFTDPRGDVPPIGAPDVDIVSGRLDLTRTELVATLTLAATTEASGADMRGPAWRITYVANGLATSFELRRAVGVGSERSSVSSNGVALSHTVSHAGDRVVWRLKRTSAPQLKRGAITVTTASGGTSLMSTTFDSADRTDKRACVLKA